MQVQVNCDKNIEGGEELMSYVSSTLKDGFKRFENAITRIEVHLADENGAKTKGKDKKCLLEARIANHQPLVVSHLADNLHQALDGASDKLLRAMSNMAGRMTDRKTSVREKFEVEEDFSDEE